MSVGRTTRVAFKVGCLGGVAIHLECSKGCRIQFGLLSTIHFAVFRRMASPNRTLYVAVYVFLPAGTLGIIGRNR
jgi:hypothetical protein